MHFFLRLALRPLYKFVFNSINSVVIFQNPSDKEILISLGITNKFKSKTIKGSGVDISFFKPSKLNNIKNSEKPRFYFHQDLLYEKGIKELIGAKRDIMG